MIGKVNQLESFHMLCQIFSFWIQGRKFLFLQPLKKLVKQFLTREFFSPYWKFQFEVCDVLLDVSSLFI